MADWTETRSRHGVCVDDDPFLLQPSDHPGMALVLTPLTGSNYFSWSTVVRTALEAKDKLCFVDGTLEPPTDATRYKKWKKVDSMIKSWLRNSISKDLDDNFVYSPSAKHLWEVLEKRFGVSNTPQMYQVQREMLSTEQGNHSVTQYFSKLNQCWDEFDRLMPLPGCGCTGCSCCARMTVKLKERADASKLLQFLMGLNKSFDNVRSQILNLDPAPDIDRDYSMVLRVESQRAVNMNFSIENPDIALFAKASGSNKGDDKASNRKKEYGKKSDKQCDHCHSMGHTRETCFKLHGYPDWYDELKKKKSSGFKKANANMVTEMAETPFDASSSSEGKELGQLMLQMQIMQQELAKLVSGKIPTTGGAGKEFSNLIFAGPEE